MSITAGPVSGIVNSGSQPVQEAPLYVSRTWRTQDGLPENRIRALAQTPDGYLWVGTSGGLARFDGQRFAVFDIQSADGLRGQSIRVLRETKDGTLWIAPDTGGLLSFKDGTFNRELPNLTTPVKSLFGSRDGERRV